MQAQVEFIARQLNDHAESKRGVKQGTFHTWSESHIKEALTMGVCYLFSIKPDEFGELQTMKLVKPSCHLKFPCGKVLDVLGIGDCNNVTVEENQGSNNLLSMIGSKCTSGEIASSYTIEKSAKNIYTASGEIPADTIITYICAKPPTIETIDESTLCEHDALVTAFALWWLLLTDNESRTNLERAKLYYQMVRDYVETKLLLEFSLNEDDYKYGRRRVND